MRRAALTLIVAVLLVATGVAEGPAQRFVYVVTSNQQFGTVNLDTGAFAQIGPNTPEGQANLVWGQDGSLFSLTYSGNLEAINPVTGVTTVVGQTGLYFNAFDLAGVQGQLYATDFANNIYSVDPRTGAAALIRATGIPPDPSIPFTVNNDGTINLCDESFYGVAGRLFATFDAFTLDPVTLAKTPVVSPTIYEIDPRTGVATLVAPTALNVGATVEMAGRFYGFQWMATGFTEAGPQIVSELVTLDLSNGIDQPRLQIDQAAGGITGAAPVRGGR
jgi:hypothetical protein